MQKGTAGAETQQSVISACLGREGSAGGNERLHHEQRQEGKHGQPAGDKQQLRSICSGLTLARTKCWTGVRENRVTPSESGNLLSSSAARARALLYVHILSLGVGNLSRMRQRQNLEFFHG